MNFIGVDPGKSGGLAVIRDGSPSLYSVYNPRVIPFSQKGYIDIIKELKNGPFGSFAVIERVHSMPKQGVSSSFNFGLNFGWILGLFDFCAIPYELVLPQKWKKEFSCTSDKNTSISVAQRLFPDVNLKRTDRCSVAHDGMAEALLMAEYARRIYKR